MSLSDLTPTLQLAIGPVILISGVGLILLSMTNRFGRVIDRARLLTQTLKSCQRSERNTILQQLKILSRRARLVRAGITLGLISALLAAVMIISLFVGALFQLHVVLLIAGLFILCLTTLILCLLLFIAEVNLSLRALWLEIPPEGRSTHLAGLERLLATASTHETAARGE